MTYRDLKIIAAVLGAKKIGESMYYRINACEKKITGWRYLYLSAKKVLNTNDSLIQNTVDQECKHLRLILETEPPNREDNN